IKPKKKLAEKDPYQLDLKTLEQVRAEVAAEKVADHIDLPTLEDVRSGKVKPVDALKGRDPNHLYFNTLEAIRRGDVKPSEAVEGEGSGQLKLKTLTEIRAERESARKKEGINIARTHLVDGIRYFKGEYNKKGVEVYFDFKGGEKGGYEIFMPNASHRICQTIRFDAYNYRVAESIYSRIVELAKQGKDSDLIGFEVHKMLKEIGPKGSKSAKEFENKLRNEEVAKVIEAERESAREHREEVRKEKETVQKKTAEIDLKKLDNDIETNLRREIERQKLEMEPEEVIEVIEAEKKFVRDVIEKYEQWATEKDATVLWDIDDTMGLGFVREGQAKFLFRPGILPLLAQLKARFPQIKNGLITDRPREQVLKELGDAEDLGPLADFIDSGLVFSSGKISRVLQNDARYRQKGKEIGFGYTSGAAEKAEMLDLIKGKEDALARQKSQEHPDFKEQLEPYLSQVTEPIPNAKIIDDFAAVKNPEHDGLWVNPREYNAYASSEFGAVQWQ
ncbi:hypothetical protein JW752_02485, partial [Candidatus Peregrinibacteria bacterium]|nr:hypothetical protein [Candidatus Peregrinibacteria bacterium]